jgi:hypothetical protein
MNLELHAGVARQPQVNVATMAEIVKELLAGNEDQQQNGAWLHQRSRAAQLGDHEWTALETLRVRLCERGATLLDTVKATVIW